MIPRSATSTCITLGGYKRRIKIAPEVKGVIEYLNEKRKVIVLKNQDDRIKTVTIKPL